MFIFVVAIFVLPSLYVGWLLGKKAGRREERMKNIGYNETTTERKLMDKNELNEALQELSGNVLRIGQGIGSEENANAHDLEILSRSLTISRETLDSIVNVLINQQL